MARMREVLKCMHLNLIRDPKSIHAADVGEAIRKSPIPALKGAAPHIYNALLTYESLEVRFEFMQHVMRVAILLALQHEVEMFGPAVEGSALASALKQYAADEDSALAQWLAE
jgi:hypothetical protein